MKSKYFTLIMLLLSIECVGQSKTDAKSIFKMYLFLDHVNVQLENSGLNVSKGDSLYQVFDKAFSLRLDTLTINSNFDQSPKGDKFKFYELLMYDMFKHQSANNVTRNRKFSDIDEEYLGIPAGGADSYIVAINENTGLTYRLKGFRSNDFLSFLSDFKETYREQTGAILTSKRFLQNYKVERIDFTCLYEALMTERRNDQKFPCLRRVGVIPSIK